MRSNRAQPICLEWLTNTGYWNLMRFSSIYPAGREYSQGRKSWSEGMLLRSYLCILLNAVVLQEPIIFPRRLVRCCVLSEQKTEWHLDLRVFKAVYRERLTHLNNCIGRSSLSTRTLRNAHTIEVFSRKAQHSVPDTMASG